MRDLIVQKISFPKFWRTNSLKYLGIAILYTLIFSACSTAKLEARLEANPQCKDVINPKTGAVMPCPGSDKTFYRSIGLESAKVTAPVEATVNPLTSAITTSTMPSARLDPKSNPAPAPAQFDCKPQLHKKTGGMLPCPSPD